MCILATPYPSPHDPITVYQTGNSRYKSPFDGSATLIHTNLSNGYELFHQGKIKWDSCDSYFGNVFGGYCGEKTDGPKLLSGGLFGKKGGALAMYGVTPYPSQPLLKYPPDSLLS